MFAQSTIIPKSLTVSIKIQIMDNADRIMVPVKDDANLEIKLFLFTIQGNKLKRA